MTNYFKRHCLFALFLLLYFCANSQNNLKTVIISGYISSSNSHENLIGVNVYLKGTTIGTNTDENGFYSLKLPEGSHTVGYSFIGCKTKELEVNLKNDKRINIVLEQIDEMLDEINITSQRKFFGNMDYGREIPIITSREIEKLNSTNASDILHARLAGVWATKTSGAPGDQQKIRIRGQASFFSSSEPLYVIDGVPVPIVNLASLGIGDLNMHDIESVTVLKDASSTALYGYQGGNGVILIDTKQRSGSRLNFLYKTGQQRFNNYYDLMNTKDFLSSLGLAQENISANAALYYPEYSRNLADVDRQNEIFQTGLLKEYQLSGGGKLANWNYYLSGNYSDHKGVVKQSEQQKYSFTSRIGTTFNNKLALNLSYRGSYQTNKNNQNEYLGNPLLYIGLSSPACYDSIPFNLLFNENTAQYNPRTIAQYDLLNRSYTPSLIMQDNHHSYDFSSNSLSFMGKFQLNDNWKIDLMESFMYRQSTYTNNSSFFRAYSKVYESQVQVDMKSEEQVALFNHQTSISYTNQFKAHHIEALLAHRFYSDQLSWKLDSLDAQIPEHYYLRNSMAGHGKFGSVVRRINSMIGHVSYNYRNTYFISAIANLSQLKEGLNVNYFSVFPSISASWDLAKEPFWNTNSWFNEFSLYTNYGSSGNYPLNGLSNDLTRNPNADLYNRSYWKDTIINYNPKYLAIQQLANHNLEHETVIEYDLGLKTSFFKDKLKLNASWFSKKIGNQIILRDIPYYYGGGKMYINLGDISVTGYEMGFEAIPINRKNIDWSIVANISSNQQSITKIADDKAMVFDVGDLLFPVFNINVGDELGDIYGYKYLGKWTDADKENKDIRYAGLRGMKFENADTINPGLDANDRTVIGNSIPDFNCNFISSFRYKDFMLDVVLYSSLGVQKYNATRAATFISGVNRDLVQLYNDSLSALKFPELYESSYFVEDASFIRIKTITIAYQPHDKIAGIDYGVTLSLENIFTFTKYKGYDPEATIFTDNNFSDNAIDRGAYPNPRSIYLSINLKF